MTGREQSQNDADEDPGIVKSMTNGKRSDLNCEAMIMNTTMTARPRASPRPENVLRISWT